MEYKRRNEVISRLFALFIQEEIYKLKGKEQEINVFVESCEKIGIDKEMVPTLIRESIYCKEHHIIESSLPTTLRRTILFMESKLVLNHLKRKHAEHAFDQEGINEFLRQCKDTDITKEEALEFLHEVMDVNTKLQY